MPVSDLDIERRDLLKGVGGAIVMSFALGGSAETAAAASDGQKTGTPDNRPGDLKDNPQLDSWLSINADGTVTVYIGKINVGQGITTSFAQVAAEELNVDFSRTNVVAGDTARTPNEGTTAGSTSMQQGGMALQYIADEAKKVLLNLAATRLNVNADDLSVDDGTISAPNGKSITYWDLLGGRYFQHKASKAGATPKSPDEYDTIGKSVDRIDIPPKVTGGDAYIQDVERPGMLHGRILHPPSYGATLKSINTPSVESMPGVVKVVRDGRFLGVIAKREGQALRARDQLDKNTKWSLPASFPNKDDLYDYLKRDQADVSTADKQGKGADAIDNAAKTFELEFDRPYTMHGPIGPACAVAEFNDEDNLTVWTQSQGVFGLKDSLATLLEKSADEIHCIHVDGSGGYGKTGEDDVAGDAALLSQAVGGKPVRVQWSRRDAHEWASFGSAMVDMMRGGLDSSGNVTGWAHDVYSYTHVNFQPLIPAWLTGSQTEPHNPTAPIGVNEDAIAQYSFTNSETTTHFLENSPLYVSWLRSLGSFANMFANESFMSHLAHNAGTDPVQFRLNYIDDNRLAAVLKKATDMAGWGNDSLDDNQGRGVAVNQYDNSKSYLGIVVDVTVDDDGTIHVDHAYVADDSGQAVNPDGIKNQVQGGVIQATSWTLKEEVDFSNTRIKDPDWNAYPILKFTETPEVDVSVINRPGKPYLGVGEAAQGITPAAIANAVYDATGVRYTELPLTPARVKHGGNGKAKAGSGTQA